MPKQRRRTSRPPRFHDGPSSPLATSRGLPPRFHDVPSNRRLFPPGFHNTSSSPLPTHRGLFPPGFFDGPSNRRLFPPGFNNTSSSPLPTHRGLFPPGFFDGPSNRRESGGEEGEDRAAENLAEREPENEEGGGGDGAESVHANADDAGGATATTIAAETAGGDSSQSLRQWLRNIGADGTPAGRFEQYALAFEREFGSLEELALAAHHPRLGLENIMRKCGVENMGDIVRIEQAIAKLPRP